MTDPDVVAQLAQRFSLPPALVSALDGQKPPEGLLATYGLQDAKPDPAAVLTVVAHAVAESYRQHLNLQNAISHVFAGDPNAHESPTSSMMGLVTGIMASTAINATHGMQGYTPQSKDGFHAVSQDVVHFMQEMRDAGGAVGDAQIKAFQGVSDQYAPSTTHNRTPVSSTHPNAPVPDGAHPSEIEAFAGEMKGLGIDVDHFMQHYSDYAKLRRKMLEKPTKLEDYASVGHMTQPEMLDHVPSQPHPTYPQITAGQFQDAHGLATLHSMPATGKQPASSVVARFASSGAKWNEVSSFYQGQKNG